MKNKKLKCSSIGGKNIKGLRCYVRKNGRPVVVVSKELKEKRYGGIQIMGDKNYKKATPVQRARFWEEVAYPSIIPSGVKMALRGQ